MLPALLLALPLAWSSTAPLGVRHLRHPSPHAHRHQAVRLDGAPTLREQMMAYIKSVQESGRELTEDQKAMIAEFEVDDELLDQTGRPDFMKGAEVMTPEELEFQEQRRLDNAKAYAEWAEREGFDEDDRVAEIDPETGAVLSGGGDGAGFDAAAAAAAAPVEIVPVAPTVARLWMMQRSEVDAACGLLSRQAAGEALENGEARELRALLASLVSTVAQA